MTQELVDTRWRGGNGGVTPRWRATVYRNGAPGGGWWVTLQVTWLRTRVEIKVGR